MQGKILVIRGGAIGDFILTLPAMAALRSHFPQAHLEVLGYPHIVQLALAAGLVDRVQAIDARPLAGFFARHGELAEDLVDYFSEFDLIVSYLYDPDEIFQTNVRRCTVAQFVLGPHRPEPTAREHATDIYLKPLERLAIFNPDPVPRLLIGNDCDKSAVISAMGSVPGREGVPTIALHPGSGSEQKNWPESQWANLLDHLLLAGNWQLLLVGGEAEGERLQRLSAALSPARIRVAQSLPLAQLARCLQHCQAFVGHDSGISHLAAALGLPGLILWGETRPEVWRPRSDRMLLLKHERGLKHLPLNAVLQALSRLAAQENLCGLGVDAP